MSIWMAAPVTWLAVPGMLRSASDPDMASPTAAGGRPTMDETCCHREVRNAVAICHRKVRSAVAISRWCARSGGPPRRKRTTTNYGPRRCRVDPLSSRGAKRRGDLLDRAHLRGIAAHAPGLTRISLALPATTACFIQGVQPAKKPCCEHRAYNTVSATTRRTSTLVPFNTIVPI